MNIWDTAGEEKYHALAPNYYRDANGALLVFDLTKYESFDLVEKWILEIRSVVSENFQIVICANKFDLSHEIQVKEEQVQEIANKYETEYVFVSAKEDKNISDSFHLLANKIVQEEMNSNRGVKRRRTLGFEKKEKIELTKNKSKSKKKDKEGGCCS